MKKWLHQILEILLAERAKSIQEKEHAILNELVKKHEELIPMVQKTSVMVDLYWKCYAYGDELKPHIEFLDGRGKVFPGNGCHISYGLFPHEMNVLRS